MASKTRAWIMVSIMALIGGACIGYGAGTGIVRNDYNERARLLTEQIHALGLEITGTRFISNKLEGRLSDATAAVRNAEERVRNAERRFTESQNTLNEILGTLESASEQLGEAGAVVQDIIGVLRNVQERN